MENDKTMRLARNIQFFKSVPSGCDNVEAVELFSFMGQKALQKLRSRARASANGDTMNVSGNP